MKSVLIDVNLLSKPFALTLKKRNNPSLKAHIIIKEKRTIDLKSFKFIIINAEMIIEIKVMDPIRSK